MSGPQLAHPLEHDDPGVEAEDIAPVRVVVVGAGEMGRTWIRTVLDAEAATLVGVVDLVDGAAERAVADLVPEAARADIATGTALREVAGRAEAEAVIDVTSPAAHHAVTVEALHAGYPVLGEKPCAATLAEALSLAGHAETTGLLFAVSQSRRHNPHLREVARLAAELSGAGGVHTVFSRAPRFGGFREEMAQPLIVDMAIHAVDAGRLLTPGTPVSVTAVSSNPPWSWYAGDAQATVAITDDAGVVHSYTGSWCAPGRQTSWNGEWTVSCAEGTVHWDGDHVPSAVRADGTVLPGREPGAAERWELDSALDGFCRALRGVGTVDSEVHENIWTQAIVEAAVRSAAEGKSVALAELLEEALDEARLLDAADGRSRALQAWKTGTSGVSIG